MAFKMDSTNSLKTVIRTNISYIPIYKIHIHLISINFTLELLQHVDYLTTNLYKKYKFESLIHHL